MLGEVGVAVVIARCLVLSRVGTHQSGMPCPRVLKSRAEMIPVRMFRDTSFRDTSSWHRSFLHDTSFRVSTSFLSFLHYGKNQHEWYCLEIRLYGRYKT
jgi:hypothetical protein